MRCCRHFLFGSSQHCKRASNCFSDRKDLECAHLLEQRSDGIQKKFVHDGSVKHPYTYTTPTGSLPKPPSQGDRWTARAGAEWFWRGWAAILIQCLLYLGKEERGGQRHFSYKANSRPISSHILSGDLSVFFFFLSPPFSFLPLSALHSLFHFYSFKAKKRKKEKKKQGRQRLSSQQSTERGGGTDSSPEDRPESRDIPQCS